MNRFYFFILFAFVISCKNQPETIFSILEPETSNITFSNTLVDSKDQNILDYLYFYNGGGVAIGDINNDDLPDVFFVSNQQKNKLYLNKGNLKFEDITEKANLEGNSTWNTGVAMADINSDGFLDIYVCSVVGINGFEGHNELYINNGDETFTEQSEKYGLDLDNYSSSASFFDYDLDGDLDVYLLNHAVHTQESYGKAEIRNKRNYESGDKLLRNDNGKFTDVSELAGIFGGPNGYGLGVATFDYNLDGYTDIYVTNDFHEDDYFYVNNGDGTFTESIKELFGHISRFSMGSDTADINNDGFMDLMTLDMLPKDEEVLKSSAGDENIQMLEIKTKKLGYHYQYTRNMLQINQEAKNFKETALMNKVAATDWSWSVLFSDYDQDGFQDMFIANGIPKRPNDLDYIKYISNDQIKKKLNTTNLIDKEALSYMPEGKLKNNFLKGNPNEFVDKTNIWANQNPSFSTGAAYGDLDNDGDIDLVTNNINQPATVYINKTNTSKNYLKIKFKNSSAIGSKVILYNDQQIQFKELFAQRGFQSSSEPFIHFGLDTIGTIDSLKIIWPSKKYQTLHSVKTNQTLTAIESKDDSVFDYNSLKPINHTIFHKEEDNLGINFKHEENKYVDSNRNKLIPYQISDRGPTMAIGDINNDNKDDIFLGSSRNKKSEIFIQNMSGFEKLETPFLAEDNSSETTSAIINDFNTDGKQDLFIAYGGGELSRKSKALQNKIYYSSDTTFISKSIPENLFDTNIIKEFDFDNDNDLDVFVGNSTSITNFGDIQESYILVNNGQNFTKQSLGKLGMIRDAIWTDFNNDNQIDIIVVGEWMHPTFLKNVNSSFEDVTNEYLTDSLNGLWRAIIPFDIDKDGDLDYLLGNWGTNTKFNATSSSPMLMYYSDFDSNKRLETIVAIEKNGKYYTINSLDELSSQMPELIRKKFTTYKDFAGKTIEEVIGKELLDRSKVLKVHTLASGILKNNDNAFTFQAFDNNLQVSPINSFTTITLNKEPAIVCAGNYFGVTPYHGKFDSFTGALIKDENNVISGHKIGLDFFNKVVTDLTTINFNNKEYLIAIINNGKLQVYEID